MLIMVDTVRLPSFLGPVSSSVLGGGGDDGEGNGGDDDGEAATTSSSRIACPDASTKPSFCGCAVQRAALSAVSSVQRCLLQSIC